LRQEPRIPLVSEANCTEQQRELLSKGGKYNLNVFRALANHPDLVRRWEPFSAHIFFKTSLPVRDRELLTLRSAWLVQSEYQWARHVKYGTEVGLTAEEIERVKAGPDAPGWTDHERAVLRSVDEMREHTDITDATWATLSNRYSNIELMDLVFSNGQNFMVAAASKIFRIPLDPDVRDFGWSDAEASSG